MDRSLMGFDGISSAAGKNQSPILIFFSDAAFSCAAVLSTIPGRQKELEDVATFLRDLLEADLDPDLDPRLPTAHYPLAF